MFGQPGARLRQERIVLMNAYYERAWALVCGRAARDEKIGGG
jgi:hypothetical protein